MMYYTNVVTFGFSTRLRKQLGPSSDVWRVSWCNTQCVQTCVVFVFLVVVVYRPTATIETSAFATSHSPLKTVSQTYISFSLEAA